MEDKKTLNQKRHSRRKATRKKLRDLKLAEQMTQNTEYLILKVKKRALKAKEMAED